ncbi:MAG: hypothetical protein WCR06_02800, partial [bacterium]
FRFLSLFIKIFAILASGQENLCQIQGLSMRRLPSPASGQDTGTGVRAPAGCLEASLPLARAPPQLSPLMFRKV